MKCLISNKRIVVSFWIVLVFYQSVSSSIYGLVQAVIPNDVCTDAKPIVIGSSSVKINTTLATRDLNVLDDCLDGDPPEYSGVWLNFTGTGERLVARSCSRSFTYISIYKGGCNPSQLQCVAATATPCDRERFTFDTVKGTAYQVLVQTYFEGIVDLSIFASPVINDFCTNAQPIAFNQR
jgi:hypothetical protein